MKLIQADRDTLLKPLQTVTGIVERRHTLPILSNVFIERKSEKFRSLPPIWKFRSPPPQRMAAPVDEALRGYGARKKTSGHIACPA